MPYIDKKQRIELDSRIRILLNSMGDHPGTLNYAISKLLHEYIIREGLFYTNINKIMGVLDCVGKEFYRTVAAPYEDGKRKLSGPVSELDEVK